MPYTVQERTIFKQKTVRELDKHWKHQVRTYADEVWENGEKGILGRKISKVGKVM